MWLSIIIVSSIIALIGALLAYMTLHLKIKNNDQLINQIDALLPQTQCGQCSFPGCRPYATAITQGNADINQCPPGGSATIKALAHLLSRESKPLNPANGVEEKVSLLAVIDENICIGCTLCIKACPVDAILGASKQMHTVIAQECTGCKLCVAPCPVDCILMVPVENNLPAWPFPTQPKIIPIHVASLHLPHAN
ncbi:MAG: electron transport complex subunit RsxB [Gammaproteobacteria bacterium]|nr:electron transport complex subunit RsxB [Gammaproteobacteria bacterium]